MTSLFGILVVEREPIRFEHLPGQLQLWLQDVGGFAAIGLILWVLTAKLSARPDASDASGRRVTGFMMLMLNLSVFLYAAYAAVAVVGAMNNESFGEPSEALRRAVHEGPNPYTPPDFRTDTLSLLMTFGGLFAILGIAQPFVRDLFSLRWRRIWALSLLSFKEAVRKRVVWVFLAFLLVFLFPPKWFFPIKAEDELRTNVAVISFAMSTLLLLTAGLLSAFSIPTDIRQQTIHTIVTKPVERFEIVLGRFIGYTMLMSAILFSLTAFSLLLIRASNVDDAARAESLQARDPIYGQLRFFSPNKGEDWQGDSVGREWEYRKYIAGGSRQRGIWFFDRIPADLADRPASDYVPLEFAFDIFRTTKGEENRGVKCSITVETWNNDPKKANEYEEEATKAGVFGQNVRPSDTARWEKVNELAKKYGTFTFKSLQVTDYHTFSIELPPGLFENARQGEPPLVPLQDGTERRASRMRILVSCDSPSQFLGIAQTDLYILRSSGSFEFNMFKGAIGLWCRLCLIIGIAVAVSTYLHGVLAFLIAVFLYIGGLFQDYFVTLAAGASVGGGPFESLNRLASGENLTIQLDPTPTVQVAQTIDLGFGWLLRRVINIIPDVDRFTWTNYVAEGFNISGEFLFINVLFLFAYLLPWGILSYYLMRSREIATW